MTTIWKSLLVACMLAIAVTARADVVSLALSNPSFGRGDEVVFSITPGTVQIGAESELALSSINATAREIKVGKAKPGVFPIRFFQGPSVVANGFLVLVEHESGSLTAKWQIVGGTPPAASTSMWKKYANGLTAKRLKKLSGPAIMKFAGENPVQVATTFVVCVTPTFGGACIVSFGGNAKDCGVELLLLAADDMVADKTLTTDEAKKIKQSISGVDFLVSIVLSGKDVLITPGGSADKVRKMAAACENIADLAGVVSEKIDSTEVRVAFKNFAALIERTCLLIKKAP